LCTTTASVATTSSSSTTTAAHESQAALKKDDDDYDDYDALYDSYLEQMAQMYAQYDENKRRFQDQGEVLSQQDELLQELQDAIEAWKEDDHSEDDLLHVINEDEYGSDDPHRHLQDEYMTTCELLAYLQSIDSTLSTLETKIFRLRKKTRCIKRFGIRPNDMFLSGCNVYLDNGQGMDVMNGYGNLIIGGGGIGSSNSNDFSSSSHTVFVGTNNVASSSYGNLIVGDSNTVSAPYYASVLSGTCTSQSVFFFVGAFAFRFVSCCPHFLTIASLRRWSPS